MKLIAGITRAIGQDKRRQEEKQDNTEQYAMSDLRTISGRDVISKMANRTWRQVKESSISEEQNPSADRR